MCYKGVVLALSLFVCFDVMTDLFTSDHKDIICPHACCDVSIFCVGINADVAYSNQIRGSSGILHSGHNPVIMFLK